MGQRKMLLIQIHYTCLLYWVDYCFPSNHIRCFCFSFRELSMPFIVLLIFLIPSCFELFFRRNTPPMPHSKWDHAESGITQIPTDPIIWSEIYQSHSLCILIQCMKFYCSWTLSRGLQRCLCPFLSLLLWVLKTAKFDKWFKSSLCFFIYFFFQHRISFSIKEPVYVRQSPSVAHQQALCPWLKL